MPQDSLHYNYIAKELFDFLVGGRIEKISMPTLDTIVLSVRANGKNHMLLLSANPSQARMHLTKSSIPSRTVAPSFLMHLRKNIGNGRIDNIKSIPYERVVNIDITAKTELGFDAKRTLIIEIMGKHSNIIVTNEDGIITECIKHISLDTSRKRQVLPSLLYALPPSQNKIDPQDHEKLSSVLGAFKGENLHKYIMSNIYGLAPATISEVIFNTFQDKIPDKLSKENIDSIIKNFNNLYDEKSKKSLVKVVDNFVSDFYFREYKSCQGEFIECENLNIAMDRYFTDICEKTRFIDKQRSLLSVIKNATDKIEKKLSLLKENKLKASDYENDRIMGELLTANIYRIKFGDSKAVCDNYYENPQTQVEIPLDKSKSPSNNIQKYYKQYNKKKKTLELGQVQIDNCIKDIDYFESIKSSLAIAESYDDLLDIQKELCDCPATALKMPSAKNTKIEKAPTSGIKTTEFMGYRILTGKNNVQNESLFRSSAPNDLWLHAKNIHGSHTVIINPKKNLPPENVIRYAASITALYSKAKESENVPIDYTFIKFVSKPKGSALGKVIYTNQKTVYVTPKK